MIRKITHLCFLLTIIFIVFSKLSVYSQNFQPNYDEAKVPVYTLPDPLSFNDGNEVSGKDEWEKRRSEILTMFQKQVYGQIPPKPDALTFEVRKTVPNALGGLATLKEIIIKVANGNQEHEFTLALFIPNDANKPVPVFLGLNFRGNHSVHPSKDITIKNVWFNNDPHCHISNNTATEESRGCRKQRWPVERLMDRGYALATIYYGDIDPDFDDGFNNGIHTIFKNKYTDTNKGNNCASIGAWAWGLSRAADYIEKDPDLNQQQIAVFGHSRLGKASLWAGAADRRFDLVISNCSGGGGAALSRRSYGETVGAINRRFPHWFCENFKQYNENEPALPVDQHMLIALMAPRPVIVASAYEDRWADPKGEYLSVKYAEPVFKLLGKNGLPVKEMPVINRPVYNTLGYVIRDGGHDINNYNWEIYLDFADYHFNHSPDNKKAEIN